MPRETAVSRWCERVAEAAWLLALALIPIFFNLYSARHFEPDKATTLRSLALVAIAAVLIRALDRLVTRGNSRPVASAAPDEAAAPRPPPLWRRFAAIPMAVPVALYALVFLATTITSVVPLTSFWGSYQRLQGTYTNLSYILLFVAIVAVVRRRPQIERMITVTLATSVAVAGYGVIQHFGADPLPWRGDVITRVASTMGNSIFVAAYMIMVVPLALYRLTVRLNEASGAPPAGASARVEWLWALHRALVFAAGLLLLLGMLKFGAVIRTVDYRYWWILPGAVVCATAIWWLLTTGLDRGEGRVPVWPGLLTLGYLVFFALQFAASAGAGVQEFASAGTAARGQDWWLWLLLAIAALAGAYAMAFALPRRPSQPTGLGLRIDAAAAGLVAALLLVAIFFTQSRGPWLGLFAGLLVFVSLLLWQALRLARLQEAAPRVRLLRGLLITWFALCVAGGAFLVVFNLSDAPFFERLRAVPYVGRMGRLLEVNEGTGLVRRLIWAGDEHAGGAISLITSDPLRTVIGWGPESMFVAFNPFYPPALANIEARGASPDRSHQALLDELVTRGLLGLASYLFVLGSFVALSWRLIRRSEAWSWQVFFIACLSVVVCTFVEGLTGIPIVSTLMMLWVVMAMAVAGGAIAGHYRLSLAAEADAPAGETPPQSMPRQTTPKAPPAATKRRQQAARGGAAARGAATPRPATRGKVSGGGLLAYGLVAALALGAVLIWNVNPIRADMRFQQGQSMSEQAGLAPERLVQTLDDYLATVRLNPREDFYYLNLGRVLMSLAESLRAQGVQPGAPNPDARVEDLLRLGDRTALLGFVQASSPNEMMSYAEAVLLRAHDLNPLNKDHYANLGRLNNFWWTWSNDPERLRASLDWYERVTPIAPQDVTLLNERAGVLVELGGYASSAGDTAQGQTYFDQARELLDRSAELDPTYADTFVRLGDLARTGDGDLEAAAEAYVQAISLDPASVTASIEVIAGSMTARPDLVLKLRDVYAVAAARQGEALGAGSASGADREAALARVALLQTVTGLLSVRGGDLAGSVEPYRRAVELQPTNPTYSRNYSIVLSDTNRLEEAIAETERLIAALRGRPGNEEVVAEAEQLASLFEQVRQSVTQP